MSLITFSETASRSERSPKWKELLVGLRQRARFRSERVEDGPVGLTLVQLNQAAGGGRSESRSGNFLSRMNRM